MSSATTARCSITGLDCAYVRNRGDKQKKFEVIIGKSVPEERDNRFFGLRARPECPIKIKVGLITA